MPKPKPLPILPDDVRAYQDACHIDDGWTILGTPWCFSLQNTYQCNSFEAAVAMVSLVAGIAKALDHHPLITVEFDTLTLNLTTKDIGTCSSLDLTFARRFDYMWHEHWKKSYGTQNPT